MKTLLTCIVNGEECTVLADTRDTLLELLRQRLGLTGTTEIQIKSGLEPGDEIITGSYKVLKTLRNGAGVKIDNSLANKGES